MKIDSTTILLAVGAAVIVYLITRPKPSPVPVYAPGYNPYGYNSGQQVQSTTAQDIAAGGTAAASLGDLISNLFGSSDPSTSATNMPAYNTI